MYWRNKKRMKEKFECQNQQKKKKERLYEIKVVLLGDPSVGKSSLMKRFCLDRFEEKYSITIVGAYLQKEVKLENGDILILHIWDTGGQEKFRSLVELYYKDSVAAILVYDVSNKESLESLDYWVKELEVNVDYSNFIISVAGNKCDLSNEMKKVSYTDGKNFCKEKDISIFYETSAKSSVGVKELFTSLAQKAFEAQRNGDK